MMSPATRFDKHSGKILFAVWLFVIVGGLFAIEWMLTPGGERHNANGSASGPGPDRRLMFRELEPSTDYSFAAPPERLRYTNSDPRQVYDLATDAQGFIEPALRHEKPDLNIIFMGGSTTECLYVAPENRFPHLAARKLETALDLKINGINAARSGNNSMHSLLLLLGKVVPLRPDYVVLMEATNDIGTLSRADYWSQTGPKRIIDVQKISLDQSIRILTNALIPYTSDLVGRSLSPIKKLLRSSPAKASIAGDAQRAGTKRKREVIGREFARMLRTFVDVARAWGIKPVLMTQVRVRARSQADEEDDFLNRERQGGARINPEDFATTHEYFNSIIREVSAGRDVLLIDLARTRNWSYGDVYDGIHFTDRGSEKVADVIAAKLQENISERQIRLQSGEAAHSE